MSKAPYSVANATQDTSDTNVNAFRWRSSIENDLPEAYLFPGRFGIYDGGGYVLDIVNLTTVSLVESLNFLKDNNWYMRSMHMTCTWHAHGAHMACAWHAHGMCMVLHRMSSCRLDRSTRSISLTVLVYNANYNLYALCSFFLELSPAGVTQHARRVA